MGDTDQRGLTDDFDAVAKAGPAGGVDGNGANTTSDTGDLNAPPGSYEWIVAVTAIDTRAEQLRAKMLEKTNTERGELDSRLNTAARAEAMAKKGVEDARAEAAQARTQADGARAAAADLEKQADDALLNNKVAEAQELREEAAMAHAAAERWTRGATEADAAAAELQNQAAAHKVAVDAAHKALDDQKVEIQAAEKAIDALEAKSGHLWSVDHYRTNAAALEKEAATLRAEGKTAEAEAKAAEAAKARADADASQKAADTVVIDEAALAKMDVITPTTPATQGGTPTTPTDDAPPTGPDDTGADATGTEAGPAPTAAAGTDDVEARAQALRAELQKKYNDPEISKRRDDLTEDKQMTEAAAAAAEANAARRQANHDDYIKRADAAEREAVQLEKQGKTVEAEEKREDASRLREGAARDAELARQATETAQQHRAEVEVIDQQLVVVHEEWEAQQAKLAKADKAVDALEDKARHINEAEAHDARAVELQREAEALRDEGKVKDAYLRDRRAEQEVEAADRARAAVEAIKVDEAALVDAGLGAGGSQPTPGTGVQVSAETAALEAHAAQLREQILDKQRIDRATELSEVKEAARAETVAQKTLEAAEADAKEARTGQEGWLDRAKDYDNLAREAEGRGDASGAREMREEAETYRASAARDQHVAEQAEAAVTAARKDLQDKADSRKALEEKWAANGKELGAAENAVDSIEHKAAFMREADTQRARAAELEAEARALRAQGNDAAAAVRERQAARATESATTAQTAAQLVQVDEAALTTIGLQPIPAPAPADATQGETAPPEEPAASPGDGQATDTPAASVEPDVEDLVTAGATPTSGENGQAATAGTELDVTGAADVTAAADSTSVPDVGVGTETTPAEVGGAGLAETEIAAGAPQDQTGTTTFEPEPSVVQAPAFEEPAFVPEQTFEPESVSAVEADTQVADTGEPPAMDDASV